MVTAALLIGVPMAERLMVTADDVDGRYQLGSEHVVGDDGQNSRAGTITLAASR